MKKNAKKYEPGCISEFDTQLVKTLLAAMQIIENDPEGHITGFENWDTYHNALSAVKNHEFGEENPND